MRDKTNWEKHTTEDQRNDPSFQTSFSDNLLAQPELAKPKVEPVEEIPKQEPVPKPEDRPSGLNYRVEAGRAVLESKIKGESEILERLKSRPDLINVKNSLEKQIEGYKTKLENLEKEDPKDLPYIPVGKNTHTKITSGFVHGKTVIKVQPKILTDPPYALINKTLQVMWNNLPDDVRNKVKTFKVQRSIGTRSFRGGSFNEWDGTLIVNINKKSPIEHHFYHEIGHVVYDNIKRDNPEKTEKWIKAMKKITIAPTKYSQGYMDFDRKIITKNNVYRRQQERRGIPLTVFEKTRMANNEYSSKDLYENEIHSEINAYAMGHLPKTTMKYSREFTNKYLVAYKELHEL